MPSHLSYPHPLPLCNVLPVLEKAVCPLPSALLHPHLTPMRPCGDPHSIKGPAPRHPAAPTSTRLTNRCEASLLH